MENKKRYIVTSVINKLSYGTKTFKTRPAANSYVEKMLDRHNLSVDYIIERNRKHNIEFVCENYGTRFFVNRVFAK